MGWALGGAGRLVDLAKGLVDGGNLGGAGHHAVLHQSGLEGDADGVEGKSFLLELDLALGRRDVNVDPIGIDFDHQDQEWVPTVGGDVAEGDVDGGGQRTRSDGAAIDVDVLEGAGGLGDVRRTDEAPEDHAGKLLVDRREGAGEVARPDFGNGALHLAVTVGADGGLAVVGQGERDVWVGDGVPGNVVEGLAEFGGVALEELEAGRGVVEQVSDNQFGAARAGHAGGGRDDGPTDAELDA